MDSNNTNKTNRYLQWPVVLIIIINLVLLMNIISMKKEIDSMRNSIDSFRDNFNRSLTDYMYSLESTFKKEASMVSKFKYDFGEYKDKKVNLSLELQPKTYTQGEILYFSCKAEGGEPQLIQASTNDGVHFFANVETSIFDSLDLNLVVDDGDTKRIENLGRISAPIHNLTEGLEARPIGGSYKYNTSANTVVFDFDFELIAYEEGPRDRNIQEANLIIKVNNKEIDSIPLDNNKSSPELGTIKYLAELKDYEIPANRGDNIIFYIIAKDDLGLNYRFTVEGWEISNEDQIEHLPLDIRYGEPEVF